MTTNTKEYARRYYAENKEALLAKQKAYREEKKDVIAERVKARRAGKREQEAQRKREWAARNAEHVKAKRKAKYIKNKEEAKRYAAEWNRANKSRRAEISAKYAKCNPDVRRAVKAKRRARECGNEGGYSKADVQELKALQRGKCAACKSPLGVAYEVDHVIPLARGGPNVRTNLQLLCRPCNRAKGAKAPELFMQERGFLL